MARRSNERLRLAAIAGALALLVAALSATRKQLAERGIELELTSAAVDRLADVGHDPEFGARPLKRALQRNVQNVHADAILKGDLSAGKEPLVDAREDRILVRAQGEPVGA